MAARALVKQWAICVQVVCVKALNNVFGGTLRLARGVYVFYANEPLPVMYFGVEVAGEGAG